MSSEVWVYWNNLLISQSRSRVMSMFMSDNARIEISSMEGAYENKKKYMFKILFRLFLYTSTLCFFTLIMKNW